MRLLLALLILPWLGAASAATFTVTTAAGAGAGSLSEALVQANSSAGPHTIVFAIPGAGPHRISPLSGFVTLNREMTIDGYTQPGSAPNTLAANSDAVIQIEIDGSGTPLNTTGLRVCAPVTVRGVALFGFTDGIRLVSGCPGRLTLKGSFIGLDATGRAAGDMSDGLVLARADSVIGGNLPADRNLIAADRAILTDGVGGLIDGNIIGGDRFGRRVDNSDRAIGLHTVGGAGADVLLVGSLAPNRFVGFVTGVAITESSQRVRASNNDFVDISGPGIDLSSSATPDGITPNDPEDGDSGPNGLLNFPLPATAQRSASGIQVSGTIQRPNSAAVLALTITAYASLRCDSASNRSGERVLGSFGFLSLNGGQTTFNGTIPLTRPVPHGSFITLTATDNQNNTSEFSPCLALGEPAPFVVTKTADTGDGACDADCSLREAVLAANAQAGADRIHFNIPGAGPHVIALASGVPNITGQLLIDGYTQPGSVPHSGDLPFNGQVRVQLSGSGNGVTVQATASTVRGLAFTGFANGLVASAPEFRAGGNVFGRHLITQQFAPNAVGVRINDSAPDSVVGGELAADANLFVGPGTSAIHLRGAAGARVLRNQIGADVASSGPAAGILVDGPATADQPQEIGDGIPAHGNLIQRSQVAVRHRRTDAMPLTIRGNRLRDSVALGLFFDTGGQVAPTPNDPDDADSGPNGLQNHPELSRAVLEGSLLRVSGTLDLAASQTQRRIIFGFYSSPVCHASGFGEGAEPLAELVRTSAAENFSFLLPASGIAIGSVLTATATDELGNTSEFSRCVLVQPQVVFANGFE